MSCRTLDSWSWTLVHPGGTVRTVRRMFCERGISDHHDNGGEMNLDNIPRKRPDATAQPACTHVAVHFSMHR